MQVEMTCRNKSIRKLVIRGKTDKIGFRVIALGHLDEKDIEVFDDCMELIIHENQLEVDKSVIKTKRKLKIRGLHVRTKEYYRCEYKLYFSEPSEMDNNNPLDVINVVTIVFETRRTLARWVKEIFGNF